jgi:hypothetical protein
MSPLQMQIQGVLTANPRRVGITLAPCVWRRRICTGRRLRLAAEATKVAVIGGFALVQQGHEFAVGLGTEAAEMVEHGGGTTAINFTSPGGAAHG